MSVFLGVWMFVCFFCSSGDDCGNRTGSSSGCVVCGVLGGFYIGYLFVRIGAQVPICLFTHLFTFFFSSR